jgi:hypothetical protein
MMRVSGRIFVRLLLPLIVISPALGGLLASCQPAAETVAVVQVDENCPVPVKETEPMDASEEETTALKQYGIPPIDAIVPEQMETTTFSLG